MKTLTNQPTKNKPTSSKRNSITTKSIKAFEREADEMLIDTVDIFEIDDVFMDEDFHLEEELTLPRIGDFSNGISKGKTRSNAVDFIDFDAVYSRGIVNLSWEVTFELQNKSFRIERSIDGNIWEPIALIPSEGTHSEYTVYQYNYKSDSSGVKEYYRLSNEDVDGLIMVLAHDCLYAPENTVFDGDFMSLMAG